ncbi:MAG: glycosyltransferase [Ruminococcaceae bacterium]|nr:glycosyltransferase [Oscillospiraceae bacterium]
MINKEKNFISAVMYIGDNMDIAPDFVRKLAAVLCENFEHYEIICVNDGYDDDAVSPLKALSGDVKNGVLSVVNMSYRQGVELSMSAGVDLAIGDFVYEFDNISAEFDNSLIMEIYRRSLTGFDIVSASPAKSRKSSRLFYKLYNRFSGNPAKIRTETFRILTRRAINRVNSMSDTLPYRKAQYAACGLKCDTVFYDSKTARRNSDFETSRSDKAIDSLILFTDIAYKSSLAMAFIMLCLCVFSVIYTIVTYIAIDTAPGWATIMLFLSVAFVGIFGLFAVVIKYLTLLTELVFKKQKYIIRSIEKITK